MYFHSYMYGPLQGKLRLYGARSVRPGNVALPSDWEVFASILVQDVGKKMGKGIDLSHHEIKSAVHGGSFEYQYHKLGGKKKLREDMRAGHLFFSHRDNLREIALRYAHGSQLKEPFFKKWLAEFPHPYPQRYRKNIPFRWVEKNGVLLMRIVDGEVVFPKLAPSKTSGS